MGGLKEIRTRIASIKTTRQVTSAMKMVSAAKLKKAQDAILQIRPYANKLYEILKSLEPTFEENSNSIYTQQREPEKILIVLVSSNRGLCGGFNLNISKKALQRVNTAYRLQQQSGNVDFICIGKQAEKYIKSHGMNIVESHHELLENLAIEQSHKLAEKIMNFFAEGNYDRVELVYNQFLNAATQINTAEQFLPVKTEKAENHFYDYIFEPSKASILQDLIPRTLKIQFYRALLDSNAAEQGARMTAMHQATDNATELLKELTLRYNKVRQASITREILEIVSGAEALKG